MMSVPISLRVAQSIGLIGSGMNAGASLIVSTVCMPMVLAAPAGPLQVAQWDTLYHAGKVPIPGLQVLSAAAWAGCAWLDPARGRGYAAAAVLLIAALPWTLVAIMPTNRALMAAHAAAQGRPGGRALAKEEAGRLVRRWRRLHAVRLLLGAVGAGLGTWMTLF